MRRTGFAWSLALVALGCSRPAPTPSHEAPDADDGSPNERRSAPPDALTDVIQIGAAQQHTCALQSNGAVYCWGAFAGIGRTAARPRRVAGLEAARAIVVADLQTLAVERTGEVMAWGGLAGPQYRYRLVENGRGRPSGDDGREPPPMDEVLIEPLDPALSAEAAAAAYPEEVWLDTEARGVRDPSRSQWRITARAVPTRLRTDGTIFAAEEMLCTHHHDGGLSCVDPRFIGAFPSWNQSQSSHEPDLVDMVGTYLPEVCLLRRSGTVDCVRNIGDDADEWRDHEFQNVRIPLPAPAAAIASGSCGAVLLRDGRIVTWCETNDEGHIQPTLTIHPDIDDAIAIEMGGRLLCVLRRSDDVTCWYAGRKARSYMPEPRTLTALDHPTQIAVGDRHACALVADGRVQCWGANEHGQLGNGALQGELSEDGFAPNLIPDTPPTWVVAPEASPP